MTDEVKRLIPPKVDLGRPYSTTMAQCMGQYRAWKNGQVEAHGRRIAMGYVLPQWQRGLVWTEAQKVAFIESAWLGIGIGTFAYNQAEIGSVNDHLLIDGQQRMSAIQSYVEDEFKVFGYLWSELPPADERRWSMSTSFPCYVLNTENDATLRNYYNLTNFSGTPHKETERA